MWWYQHQNKPNLYNYKGIIIVKMFNKKYTKLLLCNNYQLKLLQVIGNYGKYAVIMIKSEKF